MNFQFLLAGFEVVIFPRHLCTEENQREKGVLDAPDQEGSWFVAFIVDDRFADKGYFRVVKPYLAEDQTQGWVDQHGNTVDHHDRPVFHDHQRVVAWKPCSKNLDLRA